jgi:HSP20 family protein
MLNSMIRWNPTNSYLAAREPLFKLIDSVLGDAQGEEIAARSWVPAVDVQETQEAYKLYAELPGLKKEDIQITLEHNVLRLSGERKFERDVKKESFQRIERTFGSFTRSFALPTQVNPEGVQATFDNGVLTVTVPKKEEAKPRTIAIA